MDDYKSLAEYQEEIKILKERIAQTKREFENYKIRSAKELSDLKKYAGEVLFVIKILVSIAPEDSYDKTN